MSEPTIRAGRRQIVFIMTDTQGVNAVGCYGRPELNTPNIDRLAGQGLRFERAYTTCPLCTPARAGLFTGTFPHTSGAWTNEVPLGLNIKTVGQRLRDHGVHAAHIGKWHLDATDYFGSGRCADGWDPAWWYDMRNYMEELTPEQRRMSRQADTPDKAHQHGVTEELTYGHRCSNRAIDFLSRHTSEEFLLVVSYDEPHGPWLCPPPFCDMFRDYEYPLGPNVADPLDNKPAHQREWAQAVDLPRNGKTLNSPMYFGCNSFADYQIGRVLAAVERYVPDALVIYTSDHGKPLLSHGLSTKGPAMYDESTRIPLIVRWPGRTPAGSVCANPVSQIGTTPTLLDAFGLPLPPFLEGKSLLPVFRRPETCPAETIFMEFARYAVDHDSWGGFQPIRCAFDGRFKLVVNLHYTDELYDLQNDPQEMDNLIDAPATAAVRDKLHGDLLEWMNRTRDPFRGPVWERRPWRKDRKQGWLGPTRPRPLDGYERPCIDYETGLPMEI